MTKGNHPFTICYKINYAISNSHHSIEFRGKDRIYIDELFTPLVQLESPILRQNSVRSMIIDHPNFKRESLGETSETLPLLERQLSEITTNLRKLESKIG